MWKVFQLKWKNCIQIIHTYFFLYFNENLMWHNVVKNACCGLEKANKLKEMCTNIQKFIIREWYIRGALLYKYYEWFILNWGAFVDLCVVGLCVWWEVFIFIIIVWTVSSFTYVCYCWLHITSCFNEINYFLIFQRIFHVFWV